jgi:hypothetical protein
MIKKMQHIGVQREDEFGGVIAEFDPSGIDLRIVTAASSSTACLQFIDPYGNLLVNQLQMPVMITELEEVGRSTQDVEFRNRISDLVGFCGTQKDRTCMSGLLGTNVKNRLQRSRF